MSSRRRHLLCLFACGIIIGFFLEILILERDRVRSSFKRANDDVTCLLMLRHKTMNFVNSSETTWLKHCSRYFIIELHKTGKRSNGKLDLDQTISLSGNSSGNCPAADDRLIKVKGKSAWSALCRAFHAAKIRTNSWTVIVPDSLIVLLENLRLFVRDLDSDDNHYYGYAVQHYEADYNLLSAGILLSRGTLSVLLEKFQTEEDCDREGKYWRNEDLFLGKFLKELGILPKDTRDEYGRGRFHGFNINSLLRPTKLVTQSDYMKKALYPVSTGFDCCSPHLITLDVSDPDSMRKIYFFLYKLVTNHKILPKPVSPSKPKDFFWKDFLRHRGYNETSIEKISSEEYYKIWEKVLPPEEMYNQIRNFLAQRVDE